MMVQIPDVGRSAGKKSIEVLEKTTFLKSLMPCVISNMGKEKRGSDDHSTAVDKGDKGRGKRQLVRRKSQHQTHRNGSRKEWMIE